MKILNDVLFEKREKVEVCETIAGRHAEIEQLTREYLTGGGEITYCKPHLPKDHGHQIVTPKSRLGIPYMEAGDRTGLRTTLLGDISGDDRDEDRKETPLRNDNDMED